MKFFVNGDSFTFGGGLWNNNTTDNQRRLQSVYSGRLAEKFKTEEFYNQSICLASNRRIVRTTLDFFYSALLKGENLSDYFVIIQWTELSRNEFNHRGTWYSMNIENIISESDENISNVEVIQNAFYKYVHSHQQDVDDFRAQVTNLGNFLKNHGIKYLFCTHLGILQETYPSLDETELEKLVMTIKLLEREFNWFNNKIEQSDFLALLNDNQLVDPLRDRHPNLAGHQHLADVLYDWIITQGILER